MKETVQDVNEGLSAWLGDLGQAKYVSGPHFPIKLSTSRGLTFLACLFDLGVWDGMDFNHSEKKTGAFIFKTESRSDLIRLISAELIYVACWLNSFIRAV